MLPNKALTDGELDANYFQHTPYLNSYNKENGTDLASAAEIHYEPFGLYGNGVSSIKDVKAGASIVIPPMTATRPALCCCSSRKASSSSPMAQAQRKALPPLT